MEILTYDDVDPLQVLFMNKLALDFALTPEKVLQMRQTDPRPFPGLGVYAVEKGRVVGQVGIFRLPMISTEGREDVGGVWAVSTHPQHAGLGVASSLMAEAHERMRAAGLRFSTLGTNRFRVAYKLYRAHGYMETNVLATAHATWETVHQPTRLRAYPLGQAGYELVERLFADVAKDYLGFSWRHTPFARLRMVALEDILIISKNDRPVGYALTHCDSVILEITNLFLDQRVDAAEAISAVAAELKAEYIQAKISRPVEIASLKRAGYQVANPTWGGFMIKPLVPDVSYEDAVRLFGIGTDRFLISWLDIT